MKRFFLLFSFIFPGLLLAQKEANIWYFGSVAGLDFNSGSPVSLSDGVIDHIEGCATISDKDGNLLFYTDGMTVWNRLHMTMQNGENLLGNQSASQSGVIVPHPGNSNLYYIFTVDDCYNELINGLRFSIVDMSMDGGLGAVTNQKNIMLKSNSAEKVTATYHANGKDIWVAGHGFQSNVFYIYRITEAGLNLTSFDQAIGSVHQGNNDWSDLCGDRGSARGYMKFSPDGRRLAVAVTKTSILEVLNFDKQTGLLSNPLLINERADPYGLEFSIDGTKLYVTHWYDSNRPLVQYDLNNNAFSTSFISNGYELSGIQMGTDGKIYITQPNTQAMATIQQPNLPGLNCGFNTNRISLSGTALYGLPNFIQSFFYNFSIAAEFFCLGDTTEFNFASSSEVDSLLWTFGDPASGSNNISRAISPTHHYRNAGTYQVSLQIWYNNGELQTLSRAVQIYQLSTSLGPDLENCGPLSIGPGGGFTRYVWQDGASASTFLADSSGTYHVCVTDFNGCEDCDTIVLDIFEAPVLDLPATRYGCEAQETILEGPPGYDRYVWSTGDTTSSINVTAPGNYLLTIFNEKCSATDNTWFIVFPGPEVRLGNDTMICEGLPIELRASISDNVSSIRWSDGSTGDLLVVSDSGTYFIEVLTNQTCSSRDSIQIFTRDCTSFLEAPNVMTPNGDGRNDAFRVSHENLILFKGAIANRWGEILYEWDDPELGWDGQVSGKLASKGVYYYLIDAIGEDGIEYKLSGAFHLYDE